MAELVVTDSDRVAKGRTMTTNVTLYRDGTLVLKNTSKSVHVTKGLRGHSLFAVIVGAGGRSLYLSRVFFPPTVAAQGDLFGDSEVIATFNDRIPEPVARAAVRVDVIHNSGGLNDAWAQLKGNIKMVLRDANEVAQEIKDVVENW